MSGETWITTYEYIICIILTLTTAISCSTPIYIYTVRVERPRYPTEICRGNPYARLARDTRREPGLIPRVYTTRVMNPAEPSRLGGRYIPDARHGSVIPGRMVIQLWVVWANT